jgi:hypothetical protein
MWRATIRKLKSKDYGYARTSSRVRTTSSAAWSWGSTGRSPGTRTPRGTTPRRRSRRRRLAPARGDHDRDRRRGCRRRSPEEGGPRRRRRRRAAAAAASPRFLQAERHRGCPRLPRRSNRRFPPAAAAAAVVVVVVGAAAASSCSQRKLRGRPAGEGRGRFAMMCAVSLVAPLSRGSGLPLFSKGKQRGGVGGVGVVAAEGECCSFAWMGVGAPLHRWIFKNEKDNNGFCVGGGGV